MDNEEQEPISDDKHSRYHNYPLKPSLWQRIKERVSTPDLNPELEALRKRKLRSRGEETD